MAPPAVARAEDDGEAGEDDDASADDEDEEFQEPSEADAEDLVNDDEDQPETVAPPAPASPAARAANADDRHSPGTSSPKGDAPKEGRMIKVAPSLWGAKRPTTIYFAYPPDVRVSRKGPGPAKEALGGRKLLFRTTWERNCVKNAFALAGFKRVRDGTELSAAKAAAAAAAGGLVADIAGAIGGLLGFGEEAELEAKVPKIPTALPWCASWTKHPSPEIYATQNRFQKVNHFPGSWALGRKDRLQRTLQRARKRGAKAAQAFQFVPEGYNLPQELKAMEGRAKIEKNAVWIVKPPASSCGRGIRLVSSRDVAAGCLPRDKRLVAQRYLDAPFVAVNGRKFDLRLYALVTSLDPLVVYIHDEGLVRFSAHKYTMKNLRCRYVHLTNYSVNKNSKKFVENDGEDDSDDGDAAEGAERPASASDDACKWSLRKLWSWLDEHGHDGDAVKARCHDVIVKTLIAAEAEMTPHSQRSCGAGARAAGVAPGGKRPCFEVFGFDVLLDEQLKPWLIEVNISPSLMGSSALDRRVKGRLMADVFHTVGFEPYSAVRVKRDRKLAASWKESRSSGARASAEEAQEDAAALLGLAPLGAPQKRSQDAWCKTGKPEDILLDKLSPEDWDTLIYHEDELARARSGGFERHWPPPPPRRRFDADAAFYSPKAQAEVAASAKLQTDALLPLFECLRFSDALMCRAAQISAKQLYRNCALGIPAAFSKPEARADAAPMPPPRAPSSAAALLRFAAERRPPRTFRRSSPARRGLCSGGRRRRGSSGAASSPAPRAARPATTTTRIRRTGRRRWRRAATARRGHAAAPARRPRRRCVSAASRRSTAAARSTSTIRSRATARRARGSSWAPRPAGSGASGPRPAARTGRPFRGRRGRARRQSPPPRRLSPATPRLGATAAARQRSGTASSRSRPSSRSSTI
ncbi:tubulin-tyrosine ligase family-domain-containing protein [Pelagophyceae sp. CCMP2097]|nr:tubulin-tyrosine ligase family-domain-containing protein [Pelagophyceae sp. CCMP2097]